MGGNTVLSGSGVGIDIRDAMARAWWEAFIQNADPSVRRVVVLIVASESRSAVEDLSSHDYDANDGCETYETFMAAMENASNAIRSRMGDWFAEGIAWTIAVHDIPGFCNHTIDCLHDPFSLPYDA